MVVRAAGGTGAACGRRSGDTGGGQRCSGSDYGGPAGVGRGSAKGGLARAWAVAWGAEATAAEQKTDAM
jgi:hypothetical protein